MPSKRRKPASPPPAITPERGKSPRKTLKSRKKAANTPPATPLKHAAVTPPRPPPPPHVKYAATPEGRAQVAALVLADVPQELIASIVKISAKTLRRAYRRELDTSFAVIKADIAGRIVTKARAGDMKAMMFFMETRGGWSRGERIAIVDDATDPATLSDAEIAARLAVLRRGRGKTDAA